MTQLNGSFRGSRFLASALARVWRYFWVVVMWACPMRSMTDLTWSKCACAQRSASDAAVAPWSPLAGLCRSATSSPTTGLLGGSAGSALDVDPAHHGAALDPNDRRSTVRV